MTIEAWNIVLNAVVAVVLVAYGLWLRNIVTQQLKSKDTAIGALEAVIKIKDAEISSLKSDTAPAISKAYAVVRQHANQMTAEVDELTRRANELSEELQHSQGEVSKLASEKQRQYSLDAVHILTSEARAFLRASELLDGPELREIFEVPADDESEFRLREHYEDVYAQLVDEASTRLTEARKIAEQFGTADRE